MLLLDDPGFLIALKISEARLEVVKEVALALSVKMQDAMSPLGPTAGLST